MPAQTKRPITVRLDRKTIKALDAIAESMDRDRSYLLVEAVDNYLALNAYHEKLIRKGIEQADQGQLIDHDEVFRRLRRKVPA